MVTLALQLPCASWAPLWAAAADNFLSGTEAASLLLLIPLEMHTPFLAQGRKECSLGHMQSRHWFADYQAGVCTPGSPCASVTFCLYREDLGFYCNLMMVLTESDLVFRHPFYKFCLWPYILFWLLSQYGKIKAHPFFILCTSVYTEVLLLFSRKNWRDTLNTTVNVKLL